MLCYSTILVPATMGVKTNLTGATILGPGFLAFDLRSHFHSNVSCQVNTPYGIATLTLCASNLKVVSFIPAIIGDTAVEGFSAMRSSSGSNQPILIDRRKIMSLYGDNQTTGMLISVSYLTSHDQRSPFLRDRELPYFVNVNLHGE